MRLTKEEIRQTYNRTSGYCHLCHGKAYLKNYGKIGARGACEVDHSRARAVGGSNHANNLYIAHIKCNRSKGAASSRSVRRANGKQRAPLSVSARRRAVKRNILTGAGVGVAIGRFFGPPGIIAGGLIGAMVGKRLKVDK